MSGGKKIDFILLLKAVIIWVIVSAAAIFAFAAVMYFLEGGYEYSPLFATVAVALGGFAAAFYLGNALGKNGILIGLSVGGISFIIITLVTLLINSGAVSMHILLRLIIMLLTSLIGAIIGVNRKAERKYI
ncbi:MAG: TIGR04086 family membrane protein [Clostridia bacterium]|nr:TIGR04086 family membrane protein [Clostridia bacterium]